MLDTRKILIGTSGYHYRQWVGPFYPPETSPKDMLNLYVQTFPAVEINSTYYGLATSSKMAGIADKLPEGYSVVVKTYRTATHGKSLGDLPACREAVAPFKERGSDPIFLAQFPQSFHREDGNPDHVRRLVEALRPYVTAIEFRHDSWLEPGFLDALRDLEAVFVNVDEPDLPGLLPPTSEITNEAVSYVRLHGRNREGWWGGDRYDYHYSQDELAAWLPRIERLINSTQRLLVFFNNCHRASAAQNALDFARLLGIRLSPPQSPQRSLFS